MIIVYYASKHKKYVLHPKNDSFDLKMTIVDSKMIVFNPKMTIFEPLIDNFDSKMKIFTKNDYFYPKTIIFSLKIF